MIYVNVVYFLSGVKEVSWICTYMHKWGIVCVPFIALVFIKYLQSFFIIDKMQVLNECDFYFLNRNKTGIKMVQGLTE